MKEIGRPVGLTRAKDSEFEPVWSGLKRCMTCGFVLATEDSKEKDPLTGKPLYLNETSLHSTYHGKFNKNCVKYGIENMLTYKELLRLKASLKDSLSMLKSFDYTCDFDELKDAYFVVKNMVKEISDWSQNLKGSLDYSIQGWYDAIHNYLDDIIKELNIENNNDIEILLEVLQMISTPYRYLLDTLINIEATIKTGERIDLKQIPKMRFSFSLETRMNYIDNIIQVIPTKKSKVEAILDDFGRVAYTESLRLWDLCKPHPCFSDYKILLWNTPKFLAIIKDYMTDTQFDYYVEINKSNRCLVDFSFVEAPFFFGRVEISCWEKRGDKNLIDLSYIDDLASMDEEDSSDNVDIDNSDLETAEKALEGLFSVCRSGRK